MIKILDKYRCCGCHACASSCPKQCITMIPDEEGFLYPQVNMDECIDCHLCEKVCPCLNDKNRQSPQVVFAAKNLNEFQRLSSSSGGVFYLLAEYVLKQNGVVFGARFSKKWEVEHTYVESLEDLSLLLGSKYVQSAIGESFVRAKDFLKAGKLVLFCGTPCQISGFKNFLHKEYDNLITVDLICHGVPSPLVWKRYLERFNIDTIGHINFRAKQLDGYSWKKYALVIKDVHGNTLLSQNSHNFFLSSFYMNLSLRPSCFKCSSKGGKSRSDFTIGDFWGIQNINPKLDDDKGISLLMVNSQVAKDIIDRLNLYKEEVQYEECIKNNIMFISSTNEPKERILFWKKFWTNDISVAESYIASLKPSLLCRLVNKFTGLIKRIK